MGSLVSPAAAAADSGEVDLILVRELGWGQGQPGRSFPPAWEMFFFLATHRTCRWMSYRRSGLTIEESMVFFFNQSRVLFDHGDFFFFWYLVLSFGLCDFSFLVPDLKFWTL